MAAKTMVRGKCGHPTVEFLFAETKSDKYHFCGNHLMKDGKFLKTLPCPYCGNGTQGNLEHRTIRLLERLLELHRQDCEEGNFSGEETRVYQL